ncbi:hypothetical protein NF27_JC00050 [Candidatus Jidaibacter acanthamoeba]|uniref:Uncharacterized protein n=1 Tax=Candidatus Jidaibacter acanthamoebae TaxID=86105 RepID=A0A0C1QJ10_9RICK|nr:hypothetical protein [Candidatus Jidaibacter acanthamoeba]KIE04198.1 hypothetical protein NF27_JC00050 [Candidatus Jidaibacter acanthamoeba]
MTIEKLILERIVERIVEKTKEFEKTKLEAQNEAYIYFDKNIRELNLEFKMGM